MAILTLDQLNEMDLFVKQSGDVVNFVRDQFAINMGREIEWRSNSAQRAGFESPLEALFFLWWQALQTVHHIGSDCGLSPQQEVTIKRSGKTYRLDFAVVPGYDRKCRFDRMGVEIPKIAVELDGHDFHERTKEQVAYRNERDRELQADGWLVLHYSGSELVRQPACCIEDCESKAESAFWDAEESAFLAAERAAGYQVGTQLAGEAGAKESE